MEGLACQQCNRSHNDAVAKYCAAIDRANRLELEEREQAARQKILKKKERKLRLAEEERIAAERESVRIAEKEQRERDRLAEEELIAAERESVRIATQERVAAKAEYGRIVAAHRAEREQQNRELVAAKAAIEAKYEGIAATQRAKREQQERERIARSLIGVTEIVVQQQQADEQAETHTHLPSSQRWKEQPIQNEAICRWSLGEKKIQR